MQDNREISSYLRTNYLNLADQILERHYQTHPDSQGQRDEARRAKSLQDIRYHLLYLSEALIVQQPALFTDYILWLRDALMYLGISQQDIKENLLITLKILQEHLSNSHYQLVEDYFKVSLSHFEGSQVSQSMEGFTPGMPLNDLANQYLAALLAGDRHQATKLILDSFQQTHNLKQIYLHVFQPVLREIGRLWQINQVSVAQEHFSIATTQLIMAQFYPYLFTSPKNGRVLVATCVGGELHEVGMRMVADFFEMEAWDTYYLGANTPTEAIVKALQDRKANILGVSATMTYHISAVQNLIQAVRSAEDCQGVKILVGGYPFNLAPDLWKDIGADGFAQNAVDAVSLANKLLEC